MLKILFAIALVYAANISESDYQELCKYDRICVRLKTGNTFYSPDPSLIATLKTLSPEIKAAAAAAGVDPRAVAGAILTENTLNVTKTDAIQNFLVSTGVAKNGSFLGKTFSYGLGQINCNTAFEVEAKAASSFKRPPRSRNEVCEALTDSKESIAYAAVIIRDGVDAYAEQGIDISKDIGIQTTLYNLGKVREKAIRAKASGATPKVNYFGFFTNSYLEEITGIVGATTVAASVANRQSDDLPLVDGLQRSIDLQNLPPACATKINDNLTRPAFNSEVRKTRSSTGPARILSRTTGCNLDSWLLVEDAKENIGWVKESEYQKNISKFGVNNQRQCTTADNSCVMKLKTSFRNNLVANNTELGATDFSNSPIDQGENRSMSLSRSSNKFNSNCGAASLDLPNMRIVTSDQKIDQREIESLRSRLGEKLRSGKVPPEKLTALGIVYDLGFCKNDCYGDRALVAKFIEELDQKFDRTQPILLPTLSFAQAEPAGSIQPLLELAEQCFAKVRIANQNAQQVRNRSNVNALSWQSDLFYEVEDLVANLKRMSSRPITVQKALDLEKEAQGLAGMCVEFIDEENKFINEKVRPFLEKVSRLNRYTLLSSRNGISDSFIGCGMNFKKTATMIQQFLGNTCVDKVFVTDPVLYDIFNKTNPGQVVFNSTKRNDTVSLSFHEKCEGDLKVYDGKTRKDFTPSVEESNFRR